MQAKSFLGEKRSTVRHFYATVLLGEVSDASIQGYLRAASQIEEVWQQLDSKLAQLIAQGIAPWEAYTQLRYALAFVQAARTYQMFVKELLAADAAFDPKTAGYLPRITYDQANALCYQLQPALHYALIALNDATYVPDVPFPLTLGPRIENEGRPCPVTHLQGIIAATDEVSTWAIGLKTQYQQAAEQAAIPIPTEIAAHLVALQRVQAQAESQWRFGTDFAGQVTQGEATPEMHMQAEDYLWNALQSFFLLNQAVAMPELLRGGVNAAGAWQGQPRKQYHDVPIEPSDLWRVAAPNARHELRVTAFGTQEMQKMWQLLGGILSAQVQQYLDEVEAAVARGDAFAIAAMANCPFEPIYRTRRPLTLVNTTIPTDNEFHWNFHQNRIEYTQRFGRAGGWQECQEDGQHGHRHVQSC